MRAPAIRWPPASCRTPRHEDRPACAPTAHKTAEKKHKATFKAAAAQGLNKLEEGICSLPICPGTQRKVQSERAERIRGRSGPATRNLQLAMRVGASPRMSERSYLFRPRDGERSRSCRRSPSQPSRWRRASGCSFSQRCRRGGHARGRADGQRVGPHLVPLAQEEPVGFEELAYAQRTPAHDVLQDRHQHAQRVVAQNGAPCDLVMYLFSETAIVNPSRRFTCIITCTSELPSPT